MFASAYQTVFPVGELANAGLAMARPWQAHGQAMARPWQDHGQAMALHGRTWPYVVGAFFIPRPQVRKFLEIEGQRSRK